MQCRNIILEGKIKEWLKSESFIKENVTEQAAVLQSLIHLYHATKDAAYKDFVMAKVDEYIKKDGSVDFTFEEQNLNVFYLTNIFIFARNLFEEEKAAKIAASCGADSADLAKIENPYEKAVLILAEKLNTQKRTKTGIFMNKESKQPVDLLAGTYFSQPFYMNYETILGGKERYNDVIAQVNQVQEVYEAEKAALSQKENAYFAVAAQMYACALIDTMAVSSQQVYEVYNQLRAYFKVVVKDLLNADVKGLHMAYAILKGCRLKALHTELYADRELAILLESIENAEKDFASYTQEQKATLVLAYAESLENRAYQNYLELK